MTARRLLTGLASLAVLLVMVAGVPVALWAMQGNPLPTSMPGAEQVWDSLSRPDTDGSLFVGVVTLAGWLAWAWFSIGVLVELLGLIRGASLPSVTGLRVSRRWAAGLIGGVLLLSPATAMAQPTAPSPGGPAGVSVTQAPTDASERIVTISYIVGGNDTLWRLAEVFLGDGERWQEIAAANPDVVPDQLRIGQQLTVPTNLLGPGDVYTVAPDDTLWGIAAVLLGDGERWQELTTVDGDPLDPHQLTVGQQVRVPLNTTPHPAPPQPIAPVAEPAPASAPEQQPIPDVAEAETPSTPAPASEPAPEPVPEPAAVPGPVQDQPAPAPADAAELPALPPGFEAVPTGEPTTQSPQLAPPPTDVTDGDAAAPPSEKPQLADPTTPAPAWPTDGAGNDDTTLSDDTDSGDDAGDGIALSVAGMATLTAIGVTAALAVRRRRQQHDRRRGHKIALPEGSVAESETAIAAAATDEELLAHLDGALRHLAGHFRGTDTRLPDLWGASVQSDSLTLAFPDAAEVHLPPPWVRTDEGAWALPSDARLRAPEAVMSPYPALVQLGQVDGAEPMLVNLEQLGHLALTGPEQLTTEVARSLALSLSLSPLATELQVTLVGIGHDIVAALADPRVTFTTDIDTLLVRLDVQTRTDVETLTTAGLESVSEARATCESADAAAAEVIIVGTQLTAEQNQTLNDILQRRPKIAVAVVSTQPHPEAAWEFAVESEDSACLRVAGSDDGIEMVPDRVGTQAFAEVVTLIDTTARAATKSASSMADSAAEQLDQQIRDTERPADLVGPPAPTLQVIAGGGLTSTDEAGSSGSDAIVLPHIWIRMLGEPAVTPLHEPEESVRESTLKGRVGTCTEMAAILISHPGIRHYDVDAKLWPHSDEKSPAQAARRRQDVFRRLRAWLGTTESGDEAFPRHLDRTGQTGYRLHDDVLSDWDVWQQLLPEGPYAASTPRLQAAAELVSGPPFANVPARRYLWAEHLQQEMTSAVADGLEELAARYLQAGDFERATQISEKALDVDPSREGAWRIAILLTCTTDTEATCDRISSMLAFFSDIGIDDLEPETDELLASLADYRDAQGEYPYRAVLTPQKTRKIS